MRRHDANPWKGFVLGLVAGTAGTVAMGGYWRVATAVVGEDPRAATRGEGPHPLDDISLIGTHHEEEESSTAAIGRIVYERLAGQPPQEAETKSTLSYLVHYGYGALQGGLYGIPTALRKGSTLVAGSAFGTGLWLFGDELMISLLGLAGGPGRYPLRQHLHRWGAHLTYGVTAAATLKLLRRLL